jgi:hypothetical protein
MLEEVSMWTLNAWSQISANIVYNSWFKGLDRNLSQYWVEQGNDKKCELV